jgi:penicillin-binding protein 2
MSFHPNDVIRRGRVAAVIVCGVLIFLLSAFFRTQIIGNQKWTLQSEENRLREVPLPAPRGVIFDRHNRAIADNVVGYSVALLSQNEDTLRATMTRLRSTIDLTARQFEAAIRRYRKDPSRPTVIFPDASFDLVSVLEEHRMDFPSLIIQSSPKRVYPAGQAVGAFVGYISEINEGELTSLSTEGYKPGQQIGKQGLEKQYEAQLRGREGVQFIEVDSRNRPVGGGARIDDIKPVPAKPLFTNIDLDLQTFIQGQFGDTLRGGAVAMDPKTGAVLAVYSAPSIDPNRFVGGVSFGYYDSLSKDPRQPLYNKALQGRYPPGSTWKLATSIVALENNVIGLKDRMPEPCTGFFYFGNRPWRCWEKKGHGYLDLTGAIEHSCDVYFYQVGLKLTLSRLVAGGVKMGFLSKSGIDLPEELTPKFPNRAPDYFNEKYGPRNWTEGAAVVNMSIGQGENSQTILNMARFYSALATDGTAPTPRIVRTTEENKRTRLFTLPPDQMKQVQAALAGVVSSGGTAAGAQIQGLSIAGKTGTAQSGRFVEGKELNHAWFVGYAPANDPKIVVALMLEYVPFHGSVTARLATQIMERYLKVTLKSQVETEG